jgi:hypothetical protein
MPQVGSWLPAKVCALLDRGSVRSCRGGRIRRYPVVSGCSRLFAPERRLKVSQVALRCSCRTITDAGACVVISGGLLGGRSPWGGRWDKCRLPRSWDQLRWGKPVVPSLASDTPHSPLSVPVCAELVT